MTDERRDVHTQRQAFDTVHPFGRRIPRLAFFQQRQHDFAGQSFHTRERVGCVFRRIVHGRYRTASQNDGRHTVPGRFLQPRGGDHFGIVVRVGVDESRCDPAVRCVDHTGPGRGCQRLFGDAADAAVFDENVAGSCRIPKIAREQQPVFNQQRWFHESDSPDSRKPAIPRGAFRTTSLSTVSVACFPARINPRRSERDVPGNMPFAVWIVQFPVAALCGSTTHAGSRATGRPVCSTG